MAKLCGPRSKTHAYKMDDDIEKKEAKGTKKCVIKRRIKFDDYTVSLFNRKTLLRSQQRFKSDHHTVHTEEINKAAITSNDDKRLQTYDKITTYPHRTRMGILSGNIYIKNNLQYFGGNIYTENNEI